MAKILVVGGAGFIGSHTVIALLEGGFDPVIVDDFSNSDRFIVDNLGKLTGKKIPLYEQDYRDTTKLSKVIKDEQIDGIIHFAAFKAVDESTKEPLKYYDNNVSGFIKLLEASVKNKIKYFVFSSSAAVYGDPPVAMVTEDTLCQPMSVYGRTKYMDELILEDVCRAHSGLKAIALRYFNVVGSHDSHLIGELPKGKPQNLLPIIVQVANKKLPNLTIFGDTYNTKDGTCLRDYIHVVDLAGAHVAALNKIVSTAKHSYDVYNVGTGKPTSVKELVDTFERVNGIRVNKVIGKKREGDPVSCYASVQKAKTELKWKANKTIEDSVRDAWMWQKSLAKPVTVE